MQTTNILWIGKSADSLAGNEKSGVSSSHDNIKYYHTVLGLLSQFLKTDQCAAEVELNRDL